MIETMVCLIRTAKSKENISGAETGPHKWHPSVRGPGSALVPCGGRGRGHRQARQGPSFFTTCQQHGVTWAPRCLLGSWLGASYM